MTNVEVINFGDCLLRSGGAEAIAKAISSNQYLKELILSYNEIRKDAAILVAEAVEGKEHLKKLDLNGNQLGEEGIEELSGTLEAFDMVDVLGSLSDDEGDDIDDEEDEEGEGEEEEEEEGEAVDDPELQVRGTAITPTRENQSPLKVSYTAQEFLDSPSADRLLGLGKERAQLLVKELGTGLYSLDDADCAASSLMKVASIVTDDTAVKSAAFQCADAILTRSLQSEESQPTLIANGLLVHMGLLKSEEKVQPISDLQGPLILLQHIFQQVYFPRSLAQLFIAFLTRSRQK
uniref:Ran-GTPase activating protein 1 C-terminal domain-containing protein n=1 Tax=Branchiostoma floridae TaxID=7739 RepID=C3YQ97_BRAFL|eukprot:XP_002601517.1 hypothetical protein BRAFLDRAFT_95757 [Branchiostoma floridae]